MHRPINFIRFFPFQMITRPLGLSIPQSPPPPCQIKNTPFFPHFSMIFDFAAQKYPPNQQPDPARYPFSPFGLIHTPKNSSRFPQFYRHFRLIWLWELFNPLTVQCCISTRNDKQNVTACGQAENDEHPIRLLRASVSPWWLALCDVLSFALKRPGSTTLERCHAIDP